MKPRHRSSSPRRGLRAGGIALAGQRSRRLAAARTPSTTSARPVDPARDRRRPPGTRSSSRRHVPREPDDPEGPHHPPGRRDGRGRHGAPRAGDAEREPVQRVRRGQRHLRRGRVHARQRRRRRPDPRRARQRPLRPRLLPVRGRRLQRDRHDRVDVETAATTGRPRRVHGGGHPRPRAPARTTTARVASTSATRRRRTPSSRTTRRTATPTPTASGSSSATCHTGSCGTTASRRTAPAC